VIFQSQRPQNGLIMEEQAKAVFLKSQLPNQIIDKIRYCLLIHLYNITIIIFLFLPQSDLPLLQNKNKNSLISDLNKDGKFDLEEFCIGMRMTYDLMTGTFKAIPTELPLELIPKGRTVFGGNPTLSVSTTATSTGGSGQTLSAPRQGPSPRPSPNPSPRPSPSPSPHPSPPAQFKTPSQPSSSQKQVGGGGGAGENPEQIEALEREIEAESQKASAISQKIDLARQEVATVNQQVSDFTHLVELQQKLLELGKAEAAATQRHAEKVRMEEARRAEGARELNALVDQGQELITRLSQTLEANRQRLVELGRS